MSSSSSNDIPVFNNIADSNAYVHTLSSEEVIVFLARRRAEILDAANRKELANLVCEQTETSNSSNSLMMLVNEAEKQGQLLEKGSTTMSLKRHTNIDGKILMYTDSKSVLQVAKEELPVLRMMGDRSLDLMKNHNMGYDAAFVVSEIKARCFEISQAEATNFFRAEKMGTLEVDPWMSTVYWPGIEHLAVVKRIPLLSIFLNMGYEYDNYARIGVSHFNPTGSPDLMDDVRNLRKEALTSYVEEMARVWTTFFGLAFNNFFEEFVDSMKFGLLRCWNTRYIRYKFECLMCRLARKLRDERTKFTQADAIAFLKAGLASIHSELNPNELEHFQKYIEPKLERNIQFYLDESTVKSDIPKKGARPEAKPEEVSKEKKRATSASNAKKENNLKKVKPNAPTEPLNKKFPCVSQMVKDSGLFPSKLDCPDGVSCRFLHSPLAAYSKAQAMRSIQVAKGKCDLNPTETGLLKDLVNSTCV